MSQVYSAQSGSGPPGSGIIYLQGNSGGQVGSNPATDTVMVIGNNTQGINIVGVPGSYTLTVSGIDATTAQKGVVLLASNAETIAGTNTTKAVTPDDLKAKLGVQTSHGLAYGAGTAAAIAWLGEASDGQIPIGDTGGIPILANITSSDGSLVITNGPGTIDITIDDLVNGTATTIGAVTANVLTIPLGIVAGTHQFEARVRAFNASTPTGAGYNIYATLITDGVTATLIGNQDTFNETAAMAAADAYFIASGNSAILQVLGVAGLTINWAAESEET